MEIFQAEFFTSLFPVPLFVPLSRACIIPHQSHVPSLVISINM